jgi:hypothetical protein
MPALCCMILSVIGVLMLLYLLMSSKRRQGARGFSSTCQSQCHRMCPTLGDENCEQARRRCYMCKCGDSFWPADQYPPQ